METTIEGMLNRDEMERRRLEAAQHLLNGTAQAEVAPADAVHQIEQYQRYRQ